MAQPPAPAAPATPSAPAADPLKPAAGKGPLTPPPPAPAADPKVPADGADKAPAEAKKPANQLEADLMEKFGADEWQALSQRAKDHLISAEMKTREADKRMQLAAKLKKDLDMTNAQVAQLFEALRKDPWRVLGNPALGHDVRKMAEEYVWQMIQEQRMSPEQREAVRVKMENEQLRAERAMAKQEQEKREMDALTAQRRAYWEKTIPEAIEAAGLPKTSYTVRRFAEYVKAASRQRIPADMPAIAQQIKQELIDLQGRFLLPPKWANETEDQYEDRVLNSAPSDYVKMLRKADLKRLRAKGLAPKPGPKPTTTPAPAPNKKMLMSDWLAQKDQRLGRG